ncbi:formimidoylglutamate deiminase [Pleionea sediminis]|uniref:formimidoylglutamate deiminase n=1 Tax=Pleionea sediminis TaxID=2569479 RepID=UPI0011853066|nr:formimidoylglutamate deiminase [Pleionea sediminis]
MRYYAKEILLRDGWASDKTIFVEDGVIIKIESGQAEQAEILNGPVIPGMVNLHSHAFQKAFVGLTEYQANKEDSFWSWRDLMYRLLQRLNVEDMNVIAQYVYEEMLLNGYTTCAEFHYLHRQANDVNGDSLAASQAVIEAARTAGIGLCHCPVFYSYSGFGKTAPAKEQYPFVHSLDEYKHLLERLQSTYANDPMVSFGIAPHSLRAVSEEQLRDLAQWWSPQGPIHLHIAEQIKEVEECVDFYGQRPVEWLLKNQNVNQRWCLVHATHLNDIEVSQLAKTGAIAGICPQTEANLGDGIFPGVEFVAAEGAFGIGSDSHISISPWHELRLFEYTQRLSHRKRNRLCSDDNPNVGSFLWQHATNSGAQVVNRSVGSLAVGNKADWVVLDTNISELAVLSGERLLDAAVFAVNQNPVLDVMVHGQWRVKSGELIGEGVKNNYVKLLRDKVVN